jgi:hypothetical protein
VVALILNVRLATDEMAPNIFLAGDRVGDGVMLRMPLGPATGDPVVCGDNVGGVEGRDAPTQLSGVEVLKGLLFEPICANDVPSGGRFRTEYGEGEGGSDMSSSDSVGE